MVQPHLGFSERREQKRNKKETNINHLSMITLWELEATKIATYLTVDKKKIKKIKPNLFLRISSFLGDILFAGETYI